MTPNELSELAPIAATLNKESDEINTLISSLNEELAALNLGIEVWLDSNSESDPTYRIGFAKIQEGPPTFRRNGPEFPYKWQLVTRFKVDDGLYHAEPLLKASRNLRIEGLKEASRIIFLLRQEAEAKILAIKNARQLVSELSEDRKGIES